jgi:hypothetical protein
LKHLIKHFAPCDSSRLPIYHWQQHMCNSA